MTRVRATTTGQLRYLASHSHRLFIPATALYRTGSSIRDRNGEADRLPIRDGMHIRAAHHIPVAAKATLGVAADPLSPVGRLLIPPACWTLAAGSPFAAGEALDADAARLLLEIPDVFAVLPLAHPLVMMPSGGTVPHPMRVTDKEGADLLLLAEGNHFPGALMPQVADLALNAAALLLARGLQFAPPLRTSLTARPLLRQLPKQHVLPAFEGADTAPGDEDRLPGVGADRRLMNLPQIHRRAHGSWIAHRADDRDREMQFIAILPDQLATTYRLG